MTNGDGERIARPHTQRRRRADGVTFGACVVFAYLGATFAAPRIVPRAVLLPQPAAQHRIADDGCNTISASYERGLAFWRLGTETSTLIDCT
jgi:hypothetical protein